MIKIFLQPIAAVRSAAFTLFGTLSRFGSGPSEGPFLEQIQTNFVSLLLHLNEADPAVVAVSSWILLVFYRTNDHTFVIKRARDFPLPPSYSRPVRWPYRSSVHWWSHSEWTRCFRGIWILTTLSSTESFWMMFANWLWVPCYKHQFTKSTSNIFKHLLLYRCDFVCLWSK